jgi:tetratricopeptide (TPR) repeat protein
MAGAAFAGLNLPDLLQHSNQALELDDSLAGAYRLRGIGEMFSGDPEAALADADRALKLSPSSYFFHYLRANAHLAGGDPETALGDVDAALAIEPNSAIGHATRSRLNMALGNAEQAAQDFLQSIDARTVEAITTDPLVSGEPLSAAMTFGTTFSLPFQAEAGQVLTVSIKSADPGKVDPNVALLNPEGIPIAFNDDASDETLDAGIEGFVLPDSGTYTLKVSHANGGSEGPIDILLSVQ